MSFWRLFKRPSSIIPKDQAITIAQNECTKHEWPWLEPIEVSSRWRTWIVYTNGRSRGGNARIVVDKETGQIIESGFLPR